MGSISRIEAIPNGRLLDLLLHVAKSKCSYVDTEKMIANINSHEKFTTMRYTRKFSKEAGITVKPYDLSSNLFIDVTDIYSRENNKHFIVAAMCVFILLYIKATEVDVPEESEKVKKEVKYQLKNMITYSTYPNEPVSYYLRHNYSLSINEYKWIEITQFLQTLTELFISNHIISLNEKNTLTEIFQLALGKQIPFLEDNDNTMVDKADFSLFDKDETQFIVYMIMIVALPVLSGNDPKSVSIAIDLINTSNIHHSAIAKETIEYSKILK